MTLQTGEAGRHDLEGVPPGIHSRLAADRTATSCQERSQAHCRALDSAFEQAHGAHPE
jgi:hypothetical protein